MREVMLWQRIGMFFYEYPFLVEQYFVFQVVTSKRREILTYSEEEKKVEAIVRTKIDVRTQCLATIYVHRAANFIK
jgi:hypothetical protein